MANILEATKCDDKKRERDGKAARLKFTYATFASFVQNVSTPENLQKALDRYNSIYSALLSAVERKEKEDAEKGERERIIKAELKEEMKSKGIPAFRADQLYDWMHVKLARSFDEIQHEHREE